MIKIVLADDHEMLREGLAMLLQRQQDMEIVHEANDGVEALEAVRRHQPDVLLIDIAMPNMNGLDTTRLIKQNIQQTKVIILSRYEKEAYVHQALDAGAHGYVVKGAPSNELLEAIRSVFRGKIYLSPGVQASVIEAYLLEKRDKSVADKNFDQLSDREKQVFHLLIEGNNSSKIAEILCISSKTVDKHRANITKKIGTENPIKMVQYAARTGILDPKFWEE